MEPPKSHRLVFYICEICLSSHRLHSRTPDDGRHLKPITVSNTVLGGLNFVDSPRSRDGDPGRAVFYPRISNDFPLHRSHCLTTLEASATPSTPRQLLRASLASSSPAFSCQQWLGWGRAETKKKEKQFITSVRAKKHQNGTST